SLRRQKPFAFFFSSRRRHTRLQGDWSSDVCSSDLAQRSWSLRLCSIAGSLEWLPQDRHEAELELAALDRLRYRGRRSVQLRIFRSEERRVGKECRSRWSVE